MAKVNIKGIYPPGILPVNESGYPPALPSTPGAGQDQQALVWDDAAGAFAFTPLKAEWLTEVGLSGGNDLVLYFLPRRSVSISEIGLWAATAPSSPGGTYLLTASKNVGGPNLFAAANFDLETMGSGAWSTPALSGVAGALDFNGTSDVGIFTCSSSDTDLTGAGLHLLVTYRMS